MRRGLLRGQREVPRPPGSPRPAFGSTTSASPSATTQRSEQRRRRAGRAAAPGPAPRPRHGRVQLVGSRQPADGEGVPGQRHGVVDRRRNAVRGRQSRPGPWRQLPSRLGRRRQLHRRGHRRFPGVGPADGVWAGQRRRAGPRARPDVVRHCSAPLRAPWHGAGCHSAGGGAPGAHGSAPCACCAVRGPSSPTRPGAPIPSAVCPVGHPARPGAACPAARAPPPSRGAVPDRGAHRSSPRCHRACRWSWRCKGRGGADAGASGIARGGGTARRAPRLSAGAQRLHACPVPRPLRGRCGGRGYPASRLRQSPGLSRRPSGRGARGGPGGVAEARRGGRRLAGPPMVTLSHRASPSAWCAHAPQRQRDARWGGGVLRSSRGWPSVPRAAG